MTSHFLFALWVNSDRRNTPIPANPPSIRVYPHTHTHTHCVSEHTQSVDADWALCAHLGMRHHAMGMRGGSGMGIWGRSGLVLQKSQCVTLHSNETRICIAVTHLTCAIFVFTPTSTLWRIRDEYVCVDAGAKATSSDHTEWLRRVCSIHVCASAKCI